jgi:GTP cyclohydrolase I
MKSNFFPRRASKTAEMPLPNPEKDIQEEGTDIPLSLETVGIKDISFPIVILDKKNKQQHTTAKISMFADLPASRKGVHMSRFVEVLNQNKHFVYFSPKKSFDVLKQILKTLDCNKAQMKIEAPYFIEKTSPVSKKTAIFKIDTEFLYTLSAGRKQKLISIIVPVTSLCPCSKEISKYGAHNQRSYVTLKVLCKKFVWIEDLVKIIEKNASSPIYPLLKRVDEKYVTEKAYENPVFVEDIVRRIAHDLIKSNSIQWFRVESDNLESIHDHNAFAAFEWGEKHEI